MTVFRKLMIVFIIGLLSGNTVLAQAPNIIGTKYTVTSKALNEEKEVQIYLPDSYQKSKDKYPVVYIIDGQWYFPLGVSTSTILTQIGGASTPEFIIVGISNVSNKRYQLLVGKKDKYEQFIKDELIPMIERKFRTSEERFLFGWQFAGSFALRVTGTNPSLFKACFAADPYPLMIKFNTHLKDLYETLPKTKRFDNMMCFYVSENGETVKEGADYLNSFLPKIKAKEKGLQWEYQEVTGEEHRSTPFAALYRGLKRYYHNYPTLRIRTHAEYTQKGGLSYIHNYYEARAKRFGFKPEIDAWTMFGLVRTAMRAKNWDWYQQLMKSFEPENMIGRVRLRRALSVLSFYMENNQPNNALKYYKQLNKQHPTSARLQNAIGNAYFALKNNNKAKTYYEKAVALGEKQKDYQLPAYKKDLEKVNKRK